MVRVNFENSIREAEAQPLTEPESLKEFKKWHPWWESFDGYCKMKRGTMNLPLAYVYRLHDAPTMEMMERDDYEDTDAQLCDLVLFETREFEIDNHTIWDLLHRKLAEGPFWVFIKTYEDARDGRAAIRPPDLNGLMKPGGGPGLPGGIKGSPDPLPVVSPK